MRINGVGSSISTTIRYAPTKVVIAKRLIGDISDELSDSSYVMSVMQLMFLILLPKN